MNVLESYLAAMPAELAALETDVGMLDRSYASLDQIEDYLIGVATGQVAGDKRVAATRAARYAGMVLVERAAGSWATRKNDENAVCVTGFPGYAKHECEPGDIALCVVKHPALNVGALRDEIEISDLPLRREQLAALVRDPDARVCELRDDISAVTGREPKLDFSPASVDAVEAALQKAMATGARREQQRRMKNAAVIYLGAIAEKQLGPDQWTVRDKPGFDGFGMFRIHRWQPASNVELVMPGSKPGKLREVVEYVIEGGE
jgi:hypothetical protein